MFNINTNEPNTYDAIVVGSGISGGWAAKELCEKGFKTLVLERGPDLKHQVDYKTASLAPWQLPHLDRPSRQQLREQSVQARTGYTVKEGTGYLFVKDTEHPYIEHQRFDWMRGYQKGGRSVLWGRQSYRFSQMDFGANEKEGISIPWPVKYDEIAPWYSYAERFAGVSGSKEGLPQLPDGEFQPPMELNVVEKDVKKAIESRWPGRKMITGRAAHLTQPTEEQTALGRASCQYRNLCSRGCPFGAYFSSQAATLPAAERTGNMTLRTNSIVHSLIYDEQKRRATGVRVVDQQTGESLEFFGKIVFLCASTVASTAIIMQTNTRNGLDESDSLGRYLMDHHLNVGASGIYEGHLDKTTYGRRPNGIYVPRYRNLHEPGDHYLRGFGYQGRAVREGWSRPIEGFGVDFKKQFTTWGNWRMNLGGFGECLPYKENRFWLSKTKKDRWGLPLLEFDASFKENEENMRKHMQSDAAEMLEAAGLKDVVSYTSKPSIGLGIHEMGTARMGHSAKVSVLNKWNQIWAAPNVFCTDGAFMTSASCQNPSLTYMAFTARAVDYAVSELKKGNL